MKHKIFNVLMFIGLFSNAQNWQWARAGGGIVDSPLVGGPTFESWMRDMTVDKWGNVYIVGDVYDDIQFTGTSQRFPYYGSDDAVIAKYDKCGNFQWAIVNGSISGDANYQVTVDTSGNIYVGGAYYSDNISGVHIQKSLTSDTVIYNSNGTFYLKYDPNGNLIWMLTTGERWFPMPGSSGIYRNGDLLSFIQGYPGSMNGFTLPGSYYGEAIFIIDADSGKFIREKLIDTLQYSSGDNGIIFHRIAMDENDNIYLPVDAYNLTSSGLPYTGQFLGQSFTFPPYAAMLFKIDKNLNLVKAGYDNNSDAILSITYSDGALYSAGEEYPNSNYLGDTITNISDITSGGASIVYRVYKLDTGTLAPIWAVSPQFENQAPYETYITTTSKHVWMSASFLGRTVWDGDSVFSPGGSAVGQYLFKFDKTTGHCDKVYADSGETSPNNTTTMIMADPQENIIIGGQFTDQFTCGPNTLVTWGGTQSPIFYIEKWGMDCSDSINTNDNPYAPANLVTTTAGMHNINLQWEDNSPYRISFHIYRSPDGVSSWQLIDTVLSAQTTLSDAGLNPNTWYWYKVAAWNAAGESDYTNIDSAKTANTVGIADVSSIKWNVYPNPAKDQLMVETDVAQSSTVNVQINDVTGKVLLNFEYNLTQGSTRQNIDISQLPAGYYEVTVISNGLKSSKSIVKF